MNAISPQQNADGTIDIELDHPIHGWIPFTASPNDPHGADLYAQALAGAYGDIAAYVPLKEAQISATPSSGDIPVEVL